MSLLDLTLVKSHLRVDTAQEDTIIEAYQGAAENIVVEYLDREVYAAGDSPEPDDEYAVELQPAITAAILLIIGDLYANRESDPKTSGDSVLPRPVRALLAPWRVWRTVSEGYCA